MSSNLSLSNSDVSVPPPPKSVTLADGTIVAVDDYVYLQGEIADDPFYIGRVMEFVYVPRVRQPKPLISSMPTQAIHTPTNGTIDGKGSKNKHDISRVPKLEINVPVSPVPEVQLRARLAWFQRPRDLPVSRAKIKDTRLLIATMHSDLNPVAAIRGKCVVRHSREITDLTAWRSAPDHYYYNQLFDRYSTRLYEIVPVKEIRNAPQDVLKKLSDTYEFIFAESQKISDLVNTRRACTVCAKWCSINESLKCSLCEKHYHMQCLDPPLTRKPAKGYSWQCAACLRQLQEQRLAALGKNSTEPTEVIIASDRKRTTRNTPTEDAAGATRRSATGAAVSDTESRGGSKRLKLANGDGRINVEDMVSPIPRPKNRGLWPFRYFGININIDDVLHDDERIYPRAVSRIGLKYQAIVPEMVSPAGPELDKMLMQKREELAMSAANGQSKRPQLMLRQSSGSVAQQPSSSGGYGHRGREGGGGPNSRWHGKSAEQMDSMWDYIELQRGNHDEQLFFKQPKFMDNEELDMYMGSIVPYLRRHFMSVQDFTLLDCQDAALHGLALHDYDVEEALITIPDCPEEYIRPRAPGDAWSPQNLVKFKECLREYGENLQSVHEAIPENTRRAVVLRYYLMSPTEEGQLLLEDFENRNRSGQRRLNLGQGEGAGAGVGSIHLEVASDAGASSVNTPASSPRLSAFGERTSKKCSHCQQEHSARWFAAPIGFAAYNTRSNKASGSQRVICADCREYWQHYGITPDQDSINVRKQHKRQRVLPPPLLLAQDQDSMTDGERPDSAHTDMGKRVGLHSKSSSVGVSALEKNHHHSQQQQQQTVVVKQRPLIGCDVCGLQTKGAKQPVLLCQSCGLCLHQCCSGYPKHARINTKSWKCGVCINIANPTVSINYSCLLCRKNPEPLASNGPRQLMWRTSGNNWVHARCALAVSELRLSFIHGNVIASGVSNVASDVWKRRCSVCDVSDGAVLKCCEQGCDDGAHVSCAHVANRGSTAVLVGRVCGEESDMYRSAELLEGDCLKFVVTGKRLEVALRCIRHANRTSPLDIDLASVDHTGTSVISALVASKLATTLPTRNALSVDTPDASHQTEVAVSPVIFAAQGGEYVPPVNKRKDSGGENAVMDERNGKSDEALLWPAPSTDPICLQCSNQFSPIWWPISESSGALGDRKYLQSKQGRRLDDEEDHVKVLCHRCYTSAGVAASRGRKMASS
ncbi:putative PHD type zinc finger protein with BAH domain-containing protein [Coemansia sp. Benny D115]|nr:putative PHD type zinc finger protein with BAH domain-containing protein [Coemansia sp. Benny D115]